MLADFTNIANYIDTLTVSVSTSEQAFAVGATRPCDLAPSGSEEEEIVEMSQPIVWSFRSTGAAAPLSSRELFFL